MTPASVAVVGSGVSGLVAAYTLSRRRRVTLLEADDRLGGHADTHRVSDPATDRTLAIDTGFIVHNRRTYPVLLRLFDELGVVTQPSEMSMSIADEESGLEWAGARGVRGLFPGAADLRRPGHLRMLAEIPRFHRRARRLLASGEDATTTLAEFLDDGGFTAHFRRHFVEPLVAAVWSCDPRLATRYPAAYLFAFLDHHGMLGVFGSPTWRTVTGGSATYVDAVAAAITAAGGEVRTGAPVHRVAETWDGVLVTTPAGTEEYDAVVVAVHPAAALALLADPTAAQREVLGAMPYSANPALLHTDTSLLPTATGARASWNFRRPRGKHDGVLVTYDLTRLQRLPTPTRYLVTLGGEDLVDPDSVIARRHYEHPLYTPESLAAQARLPQIETDRIVFAGAYHGWGFHEDGARSGLRAAEQLGVEWSRYASSPGGSSATRPTVGHTPPGGSSATRPTTPRSVHGQPEARPSAATAYATTLVHRRRAPIERTFRHRSHLWVVDVDRIAADGTVDGAQGRFLGRDHFTGDTSSVRTGVDRFLAAHGLDLRGGRALMAAHPRAYGHCFNPISVHWCWAHPDGRGRPDATVVEVHNTYGDRHAYLVPTDDGGCGRVTKAMYVSPFHGTDGEYDVFAPPPDPVTGRLRIAVTLHTDGDGRFDATLSGVPAPAPPLALSALRAAALIRVHGIALWLRGLPVQPRPARPSQPAHLPTVPSEGVRR